MVKSPSGEYSLKQIQVTWPKARLDEEVLGHMADESPFMLMASWRPRVRRSAFGWVGRTCRDPPHWSAGI